MEFEPLLNWAGALCFCKLYYCLQSPQKGGNAWTKQGVGASRKLFITREPVRQIEWAGVRHLLEPLCWGKTVYNYGHSPLRKLISDSLGFQIVERGYFQKLWPQLVTFCHEYSRVTGPVFFITALLLFLRHTHRDGGGGGRSVSPYIYFCCFTQIALSLANTFT